MTTEPSFWDDLADTGGDFRRVPEGEKGAGQPLIVPEGGGEPVRYMRATSYISAAEDDYGIAQWKRHLTVDGLIGGLGDDDADITRGRWQGSDWAGKVALSAAAFEAAGGYVKANNGTRMHSLTDDVDRGAGYIAEDVTDGEAADLDAYAAAVAHWSPVLIEPKTVLDIYGVAGTPDRVWTMPGWDQPRIGDLKGLAETTAIPTPNGWTTMGALRVGDHVFDADGRPCRVTAKSETKHIGTHVVLFDDKSEVVCDAEHIWWTRMPHEVEPTARGIGEVIDTLRSAKRQAQHLVPVAGPLELPDVDLPIDPYLLGCWLGDGHKRGGVITKCDDLFAILESDGHALGVRQKQPAGKDHIATRTVLGLGAQLAAAGLVGVKQVPEAYLRASLSQRLRLLQGLFDTDGSWNIARETAVFSSVDKALAMQVHELVLTLGQRANLAEVHGHGFGRDVTSYVVAFTPVGLNPFRLSRKADRAGASVKPTTKAKRRVIIDVRPGPDVPTSCIAVDSPTSTYLCGESMIPTHNTGKIDARKCAMQMALYAHSRLYNVATGERTDLDVDQTVGMIVHLPYGEAKARVLEVDLVAGWEGVQLCGAIHAWRKRSGMSKAWTPPAVDYVVLASEATTLDALYALHAEAVAADAWNHVVRSAFSIRKAQLTDAAAA